jgi:hypothetical protein
MRLACSTFELRLTGSLDKSARNHAVIRAEKQCGEDLKALRLNR